METWVCLRAKRNENGGKESVITQPMRKMEKSVENGILTVLHHNFAHENNKEVWLRDLKLRLRKNSIQTCLNDVEREQFIQSGTLLTC